MLLLGRALLPRSGALRKVMLIVVAVAAIVVGLLAMHSLNLHEGHDSGGAMSVAAAPHHVVGMPAPDSPSDSPQCASPCGTGDQVMSGTACILALLATTMLLAVALSAIRWERFPRWATSLLSRVAALASPSPPSLLILSISRT
jgi:hypothetical protein